MGNIYENLNDYKTSAEYYDYLLAYHRESSLAPLAQLRIGLCYFRLKQFDNVVLELNDPIIDELPPIEKNEPRFILANAFYKLKEYNNALDIYDEILQYSQSSSLKNEVNYGKAWVFFQLKDFNKAYTAFEKLSTADTDSIASKAMFWAAECKRYLGENDESNKIFQRFVEKYPAHPLTANAKLNLGIINSDHNYLEDSEQLFTEAASSKDPYSKGKSLILLGESAMNRREYLLAEKYYSDCSNISNVSEKIIKRALLGLGIVQFYLNKTDLAITNLEELKARDEEFESDLVNFYLAEGYSANGEHKKALSLYTKVEKSSNQEISKSALYGKAYAYYNIKDYVNSSFYFKEFVRQYPKDKNIIDANFRLADSYYGLKNFSQASRVYSAIFSEPKIFY